MSAAERSASFDLEDRAVVVTASGEVPVVRAGLCAQQRSIDHRPCDCCDGEMACVRGVVLDTGELAAIYFATFVLGHEPVVRVALAAFGSTALVDLSVRASGELAIEAAGEVVDLEAVRALAEAIWKTDEIVGAYLVAPRTSVIRPIRR
ncbi:MAG TPA: hypothetical protein VIF62_09730 [Labilithrix sp.]